MERNTSLIKAHLLRPVVLMTMIYSTLSAVSSFRPFSTLWMSGKAHTSSSSSVLWHAARSRDIHAACHKTNSCNVPRGHVRTVFKQRPDETSKVVVIVLASFPFHKLLTNWICHARRAGMTKFSDNPLRPPAL